LDIDVLVAIPTVAANAPNPEYNVEHFTYDKESDCYICPQGKKMTTTGKWHLAKTYRFKRYTTKACKTCRVKPECSKAKYGKAIQRSEYTELINQNKERIENNRNYYRRRQAIVEHPYGTIKRQWGFSYISTKKGKGRASPDVGLMFIAYNLRRIMNIVGINALKKHLEVLVLLISRIYCTIRLKISLLKAIKYLHKILTSYFEGCLNRLKFDQNLLSTGGF
ncbi:MAG: transposase, partial [Bacteroidetes bacterium]|nr:transposase [Bacteroidota bacterium]